MEKNIKDYLHLYLGCKVRHRYVDYDQGSWSIWYELKATDLDKLLFDHSIDGIEIQLRKLSDMTEEYFLSLFEISTGSYENIVVNECKRWSTCELYVRLGYGQFIFGFWKHPKPDVRLEVGISFFIKEYLIEDGLEINGTELKETQSHFNKENMAIAFNQSVIFNKLRKDGFDCDGLIESGLAY